MQNFVSVLWASEFIFKKSIIYLFSVQNGWRAQFKKEICKLNVSDFVRSSNFCIPKTLCVKLELKIYVVSELY